MKWEENFKAFWTSFLRLCVFKTLLSLITLFPFCLFLIHQVIGGELQDRLIPIPYSKSTTDQAVREFYNCPVKLLSLYLTLYAWCIPSSKTSTPKNCCTFIFSHSTLIPQLYINLSLVSILGYLENKACSMFFFNIFLSSTMMVMIMSCISLLEFLCCMIECYLDFFPKS